MISIASLGDLTQYIPNPVQGRLGRAVADSEYMHAVEVF